MSREQNHPKGIATYRVKRLGALKKKELSLSITDSRIEIRIDEDLDYLTPNQIHGWEFCDRYFYISYIDHQSQEKSLGFEFYLDDLLCFQKNFQAFRVLHWKKTLSSNQLKNLQFIKCPSCSLSVFSDEKANASYTYCPECTSIFSRKGDIQTESKQMQYNFCKEGFFLALWPYREVEKIARLKEGKSFYVYDSLFFKTKSILLKIANHSIWLLLWAALFWGVSFIQSKYVIEGTSLWKFCWGLSITLVLLAFFHLFCMGSYHSYLMMRKVVSKYFWPDPVEKKLRMALKNDLKGILAERKMLKHPGYLFNLARVYLNLGEKSHAISTLKSCLKLCPNHPFIRATLLKLLPENESKSLKQESLKIFSQNLFLPLKEMNEKVEWPDL